MADATVETPKGIKTLQNTPEIARYFNSSNQPYANPAEIIAENTVRYINQTFSVVGNKEYWFETGTADGDLKLKSLGTFDSTDNSLYLDTTTRELRSNIGQMTQKWVWASGNQELLLTYEPTRVVYISVNGQLLEDELTQWSIDVSNKKITILNTLDPNDRISVNYQFLIIP